MAAIVQFYVNDTSPAILYSPIGDTLSTPNNAAGWNPYYTGTGYATAQGITGDGESFHTTSLDGASLTIAWIGTGIQLHGNVTNASYSINLDGTDVGNPNANIAANVLATLLGLPNERHTLTLRTQIPGSDTGSSLAFGRAIVQSTPPSTDPPTLYTLTSLNGSDVAYQGRWSFTNDNGAPIHESTTAGDQATTRFKGTAFVLQGTTSPESGNYSVTVDNTTVSYSARSSFLALDTLLHYSTGLDPTITHTVVVKNEGGGTLALLEGGFGVYASGSPLPGNSPLEPPPPNPNTAAYPRGTIAAFALAGVLAFLLISGGLYYWFLYRPRKKYQLEAEQWKSAAFYGPKAEEAGDVLDIGSNPPPVPDDYTFLHAATSSSQRGSNQAKRDSQKSSFLRWKRDAENGRARDSLGIQFRHSDIYDEKAIDHAGTQYDNGTIQSSSERTRSRTPSILRHALFMASFGRASSSRASSHGVSKGKQKGKETRRPPSRSPEGAGSAPAQASTLGSLSYMTAPLEERTPAQIDTLLAPPSYAASMSHRSSDSPASVPRSVTQSLSNQTVLAISKQTRQMEDDKSPVTSYTSSLTPPYPVRDLSKEDRGSLMDQSIDETPTLLSGPAVRQLIRSLSPRTSKASFPRHRNTMSMELGSISPQQPSFSQQQEQSTSQPQEPPRAPRPLPVPLQSDLPSPTRSEYSDDYVHMSEPASPVTEEAGTAPRRGPPRSSGTFGQARSSNTHASFLRTSLSSNQRMSLIPQPLTPSSDSHFPQGSISGFSAINLPISQGRTRFSKRASTLAPPAEMPFEGASLAELPVPVQITPATPIPLPTFTPPFASTQEAGIRDSFLDMTYSSDVSAYSHSKDTTDTSSLNNDTRRYSTPPQSQPFSLQDVRSRWSTSTGPPVSTMQAEHGLDSDNDKSGSGSGSGGKSAKDSGTDSSPQTKSSKSSSGSAPPAQLTIPPASQFLTPLAHPRFSVSGSSTRSDPVHVHPALEYLESPTESIPRTGSDVDFRHSDSDDAGLRTRRVAFEGTTGGSLRTSASSSLYPFPFPGHLPAFHNPDGAPSASFVHPETDTEPPTPAATGLASPNYLVQRVLGMHSPSGSVSVRPGHSRTPSSAFGGTSTTTPFGSVRYDTSTTSPSHLRHGTTTTEVTESSRNASSPKPRDNTPPSR